MTKKFEQNNSIEIRIVTDGSNPSVVDTCSFHGCVDQRVEEQSKSTQTGAETVDSQV